MFAVSLAGILLIFLINPFMILLMYLFRGKKSVKSAPITPSVSLITVVYNAESLIVDKINNSLSLDYPPDKYEIVILSDGSTDETENRVRSFSDERIRLFSSPVHEGKNSAINRAVQNCSGEILVFSDVGALVESNAIRHLVKCFEDPEVGGVCGALSIIKDNVPFSASQRDYWRLDRIIKQLESQSGSISSNTGTLYAIRKDLFKTVPEAVTDDLYTCLSVVKQHLRFIFEPDAISYIRARSRSADHEIKRRRRIVTRSLHCISLMRELLNPFKFGFFSIRLFINKILRRFLPVFLIMLFLTSVYLAWDHPVFAILLSIQTVLYVFACSHLFLKDFTKLLLVIRLSSLVYYFCIGNYGVLLGLYDFLRGVRVVKW